MLLLEDPILNDVVLMAIAFAYVFMIIGFAMILKKKEIVSGFTSRKIVHMFAGFAIFIIPYMAMPYLAISLPIFLWILTFFSTPKARTELRDIFDTMAQKQDETTGHLWGPLFYIAVIGLLVAVFTLVDPLFGIISGTSSRIFQARFYYAATAIVIMMIGDGLCSIIGRKYGKHKYSLRWTGTTRSLEGSLALLIVSFLLALITYTVMGTSLGFPAESVVITNALLALNEVILLSLVAAVTATIIEAISPTDIDDFTIPVSVTLVTVFVAILLGFWL
ncbi:MAG: diacylglycerol/polyprenol kinase family protein [Promethearchaeota archaeon]